MNYPCWRIEIWSRETCFDDEACLRGDESLFALRSHLHHYCHRSLYLGLTRMLPGRQSIPGSLLHLALVRFVDVHAQKKQLGKQTSPNKINNNVPHVPKTVPPFSLVTSSQ